MLMFLTILSMSLLALAVSAAAFGLATGARQPEARPQPRPVLDPPQFFAQAATKPATDSRVPVEVLLSDIERHIRLEQAAAEAFLAGPDRDALHSRPAAQAN